MRSHEACACHQFGRLHQLICLELFHVYITESCLSDVILRSSVQMTAFEPNSPREVEKNLQDTDYVVYVVPRRRLDVLQEKELPSRLEYTDDLP